jgi:hypothetical protein
MEMKVIAIGREEPQKDGGILDAANPEAGRGSPRQHAGAEVPNST